MRIAKLTALLVVEASFVLAPAVLRADTESQTYCNEQMTDCRTETTDDRAAYEANQKRLEEDHKGPSWSIEDKDTGDRIETYSAKDPLPGTGRTRGRDAKDE